VEHYYLKPYLRYIEYLPPFIRIGSKKESFKSHTCQIFFCII